VRRLAIAALLLACAGAVCAEEWTLALLMKRMAEIPAAQARFTETRHVAILTAPLETRGRLSYTRPDRISKHVLAPFEERISVEGDTLTVENSARGAPRSTPVQSNPVLWGLVESLRATLAGDQALLQRFYRVALTGTRAAWHLTLEPVDPQIGKHLHSIRIGGADSQIGSIEIREANGDRSIMAVQRDDG
jgi:outer membrane lipoprotein-sorting protein